MADAKLIKQLRDRTGMGITDCKKALEQCDDNLEEAELLLRKTQKEKAIKKADRATGEGVIAVRVEDGTGVMVEVACEQEPTTNNELFKAFVSDVTEVALASGAGDAAKLLAAATKDGTVQDALMSLAGTVGENCQLKRAGRIEAPSGGLLGQYVHFNRKAGCLAALQLADGADPANEALRQAANDVCMHAVATRPLALDPDGLPADVVAREKEVYREEVKSKPENIQEKILEGKLGKFYQEKCLLEQIFVKDPDGKKTIREVVAEAGKAAGGSATLVGFIRMELGVE